MRFIGVMGVCGLMLTGCGQNMQGGGVFETPLFQRQITDSVAIQALGEDAFSINPFVGNSITMPGIYAIRNNGRSFLPLCKNDTGKQTSITSMTIDSSASTDIIEDDLSAVSLKLNILGTSLETPYTRTKVSGYTVKQLVSGDSGRAADWVLANVEEGCRSKVLTRNQPYIVVESIAIADNAETVKGGGIGSIGFGLPSLGTGQLTLEGGSNKRTHGRVFAITGKVVR